LLYVIALSIMTDKFTSLRVEFGEGEEDVQTQHNVLKELSVRRFKLIVGMRTRRPIYSEDHIQLYFGAEEMLNDRTLNSYNLEDGSTINAIASSPGPTKRNPSSPSPFELRPPSYTAPILRTVFVKDLEGRTRTLENIPADMAIKDFKVKLGQKLGFSTTDSRLIFGSKPLTDGTLFQ
jgi:hypothetical protein